MVARHVDAIFLSPAQNDAELGALIRQGKHIAILDHTAPISGMKCVSTDFYQASYDIAAHLLGLPMGYVRSSSKDHGRQNRIEGKLVPGQKVVVVEDLISTGGSVLDAVDALREAGAEVLGVVSIFTYGMKKGVERLAAAQVKNVSLTDLDTVASTGAQEGYITEADVARLLAFRENPSDESWIQAESQA